LRNQSTAHVSRGGDPFRAGDGFEFDGATPPVGFDRRRDGVCLHRHGTILYLSPNLPGLLSTVPGADLVGAPLSDLVSSDERSRAAAAAFSMVTEGRTPAPTVVAFPALRGGILQIELTFAQASRAGVPVDVIWFRVCGHRGLLSEENEPLMPIKVGDRGEGAARATVLICDDEARLGALTAGLLTEYGFSPITVGTGEAALDALGEGNPSVDIVLLDVNLSAGQSAREVLTAMKARGAEARVILTSGLAEEDVDADLVAHPSVVGYIAKPYGVDQLVQSINRALGL
jgi:CheY-like chemotaxis protein